MKTRLLRFAISTPEDQGEACGSVFACSRDHAKEAAAAWGASVVSCEGREGVDSSTTCDGCGTYEGEDSALDPCLFS